MAEQCHRLFRLAHPPQALRVLATHAMPMELGRTLIEKKEESMRCA